MLNEFVTLWKTIVTLTEETIEHLRFSQEFISVGDQREICVTLLQFIFRYGKLSAHLLHFTPGLEGESYDPFTYGIDGGSIKGDADCFTRN
jgi:hypothetical protein